VVVVGTTDANEEQDDEKVNNYTTSSHSDRPYRYLNSHRQTEPPGIYIPYEPLNERSATTLHVVFRTLRNTFSLRQIERHPGHLDVGQDDGESLMKPRWLHTLGRIWRGRGPKDVAVRHSREMANVDLVVVVSTANCVAQRSEEPQYKSDDEHNHADCPHDRNTRDEPNEEKNQTENNHNASSSNGQIFILPTAASSPIPREWTRAEVNNYL